MEISLTKTARRMRFTVNVKVEENGFLQWEEASDSHVEMFVNKDPEFYQSAMRQVIKQLFSALPEAE